MTYTRRTAGEWAWARLGSFLAKTELDPVTGCVLWRGNTKKDGYGQYQALAVHRWAWTEFEGPIAPGMTVDHLCRVQLCVNTNHMELVTNAENAGRALRRRLALATLMEWQWSEPAFANTLLGRS